MNLVFQDLFLFRFVLRHILKSLVVRELKCCQQTISSLEGERVTLMWVMNLSLPLEFVRNSRSFLG